MRTEILGVGFDSVTMEDALDRAEVLISEKRGSYVCTPNPEIVWRAQTQPALMDAVNGADMVLPDGVGILWAAGKLGKKIPERVAGFDFITALMKRFSGSVFLLGGRPGVAEKAAETIRAVYPGITVAGSCDGYYTDESEVLDRIRKASPDILLVCLGAPRQELWMAQHRDLNVGLMAGLGGSVDILAGTVERAPLWWRKRGLEWLYRLLRQPWRIKRQLCLPLFMLTVLRQGRKNAKRQTDCS